MSDNVTRDDMLRLIDEMYTAERDVYTAANKEYARSNDNALANFDRVGAAVQCEHCGKPIGPFVALLVYFFKHLDGIIAAAAGHMSQREPVEGRIKDARMYLALLRAMFARREKGRYDRCKLCNDTGVYETGNNDLPCSCPRGDTAVFNTAAHGLVTGAFLKAHRGA